MENFIILIIVILAAAYLARTGYRAFKGSGTGCGCGCSSCAVRGSCEQELPLAPDRKTGDTHDDGSRPGM